MPEFTRRGHYRTNANGTTFWVRGHDVVREEFILTRSGADYFVNGKRVIPNVTCKHCGLKVFYYENEHGSRVFFDSLGPPWPKHSCYHVTPATSQPSEVRTPKKWVANPDALALRAAELDQRVASRKTKETELELEIATLDKSLRKLRSEQSALKERFPARKKRKRKRGKASQKDPIRQAYAAVGREIERAERKRGSVARKLFDLRY